MIAYLILAAIIVAVPLYIVVMDALSWQADADAFWEVMEERER